MHANVSITMFQSLVQHLQREPVWRILLIAIAMLALVGYIDAITGPDLNFAHFYLAPVCFVAWLLDRRWGYAMAVAAAGVCMLAERMGAAVYRNPQIQEWNLLTRLAFFVVSVWLVANWKSMGVTLAQMVDVRTAELREQVGQRERRRTRPACWPPSSPPPRTPSGESSPTRFTTA